MSIENVELYLGTLLRSHKPRILVTGPAMCGKTTAIMSVLSSESIDFSYLSPNVLFSEPHVSPASIAERYIRTGNLLFVDDIETIFSSTDVDYDFMYRFLSRKPKLIAACRSKDDVHPFVLRYFSTVIEMEPRKSKEVSDSRIPNVTFDDIGGAKRAKELVLLMVSWCVKNKDRLDSWGLSVPSGAILFGPPGTGKTLLAKAVANACDSSFYSIAIPDLLTCEVGESEKKLTRIFENARADAPAVVFIDEIQALFGKRNNQKNDSNRLIAQLISQLDANSKHGLVFCLAATNALEAVDKALLQPGRFEEIIEISFPSEEDRIEIIKIGIRNIKHSNDVDEKIETIAKMTESFTASDITGICQKAAISALMKGKKIVDFEDIKNEIQQSIFNRAKTGNIDFFKNKV